MAASTHSVVANKALVEEAKSHPQTTSSAADPTDAPRAMGDFHVNTVTQVLWVAVSASKWAIVSNHAAFRRVDLTTTPYAVVDGDTWVGVNLDERVTITLPPIADIDNAGKQMRITIADEGGFAGGNTITILPSGTDEIVGQVYLAIDTDFGSFALVSTAAVTPHQWMVGVAH